MAAAQWGNHNAKRVTYGRSIAIDPWGTVLASCSDMAPTIAISEVDFDRIDQVRAALPVWDHRKPEIYGEIVKAKVIE